MTAKPRIRKRTLVLECGFELARWGNVLVLEPCFASNPEKPCCGTWLTLKQAQKLARELVREWRPGEKDVLLHTPKGGDLRVDGSLNSTAGIRKLLRFLDLPELQNKVRTKEHARRQNV